MSSSQARLRALDVFRGGTIAAMLLVNNPGSWAPASNYAQLRHAEWNGCTLTDLIFPFFLFIVGVSTVLSLRRRQEQGQRRSNLLAHAAGRGAALVLLGIVQTRFPLLARHPQGFLAAVAAVGASGVALRVGLLAATVAIVGLLVASSHRRVWAASLTGSALLIVAGAVRAHPQDLVWLSHHLAFSRLPGVLQRIGVCYAVAAGLLLCRPRASWLAGCALALLLGSALWTRLVPIPGFGRPDLSIDLAGAGDPLHPQFTNWCSYVDFRVFGATCWQVVRDPRTQAAVWGFDPEGLMSTPAAIATVLIGMLAGTMLLAGEGRRSRPVRLLLLWGAVGSAAGGILSLWLPLNKQMWTSSYALLTAGAACWALALCMAMEGSRWLVIPTTPLVWYGRNALLLFLGSSLAATMSIHLRVPADLGHAGAKTTARLIPLTAWVWAQLRNSLPPRPASLAHALLIVVIWAVVAGVLARRRWFVKL